MHSPLLDVRSANWDVDVASAPAVVLFLHGYGSNERDLTGLAPELDLSMPWVSLRAPLELGNGGAAWFAITTPGNPDAEPVVESTNVIWSWVDTNLAPETTIIPVGFSQGGLMASQLLRTRPERVIAPVILGGFVLDGAQPADATLIATRPPVFWGRGGSDQVITASAINRTSAFLPQHSQLVERIYPGLAHNINTAEVHDVRQFLASYATVPTLEVRS